MLEARSLPSFFPVARFSHCKPTCQVLQIQTVDNSVDNSEKCL